MKKIISYLFFLLPALMLQSCLKDQEDTFDDLAAHRLSDYCQQAKDMLQSSEYGWVFEVFPSTTQQYGGYVITCKFDDQTATIGSETLPGSGAPKGFNTCYYKLSYEDGATLIFDTYSPIIHYFAEGSSTGYHAYGGDTEYVVDSIGTDIIKVHGARSKNKYYMYRLTQPAEDYLANVSQFQTNYWDPAKAAYTCIKGSINGEQFEGEFLTSRQMEYSTGSDESTKTKAYTYTDDGIRLYSPVKIGGASIREFKYTFDSHSYTAISSDGQTYTMEGSFPQWVVNYDAWAGDYEFLITSASGSTNVQSLPVTLVPVEDRSMYIMKGVNPNYDLTLTYDKTENTLTLGPQLIGEPLANGNVVLLAGWDSDAGYVHYGLYTTKIASGMKTYWSESDQMFKWTDNGQWGTYKVRAYIIYIFTGTTRVGAISLTDSEQAAYAINGAGRIYSMVGLKRK